MKNYIIGIPRSIKHLSYDEKKLNRMLYNEVYYPYFDNFFFFGSHRAIAHVNVMVCVYYKQIDVDVLDRLHFEVIGSNIEFIERGLVHKPIKTVIEDIKINSPQINYINILDEEYANTPSNFSSMRKSILNGIEYKSYLMKKDGTLYGTTFQSFELDDLKDFGIKL